DAFAFGNLALQLGIGGLELAGAVDDDVLELRRGFFPRAQQRPYLILPLARTGRGPHHGGQRQAFHRPFEQGYVAQRVYHFSRHAATATWRTRLVSTTKGGSDHAGSVASHVRTACRFLPNSASSVTQMTRTPAWACCTRLSISAHTWASSPSRC